MSFIGKNTKTKNKKIQNNAELNNLVKNLQKKVENLKPNNNSEDLNELKNEIIRLKNDNQNFKKKILKLEKKNSNLNQSQNSDDAKILKKIINDDLNKIKIKIDKNESIIKKILFN